MTGEDVRNHTRCLGCGRAKDVGCIVCWRCFKSGVDGYGQHAGITTAYKYFPSTETEDEAGCLDRWLAEIGRPSIETQLSG